MSSEAVQKLSDCVSNVMTPALRSVKNDLEDRINQCEGIIKFELREQMLKISVIENEIKHVKEYLELFTSSLGGGVSHAVGTSADTPVIIKATVRKSAASAVEKKPKAAAAKAPKTETKIKTLTDYCSYMWKTNAEFRELYSTPENMTVISASMKTVPKDEVSKWGVEGRTFSTKIVQAKGGDKVLSEKLKKDLETFKKQFEELKLDDRDSEVDEVNEEDKN